MTPHHFFFITATDTEVGKTTFCQHFIDSFLKNTNKLDISYIKPYQTGVKENFKKKSSDSSSSSCVTDLSNQSDSIQILKTKINPKNIHEINSYSLPAAPYHASLFDSHLTGSPLINETAYENNLIKIKNLLNQNIKNHYTLIEGSGGVLVPITTEKNILDLITDLQAPTILIAKQGLGTLNHTLLSLRVLLENGVKVQAIFLNEFFSDKNPQINNYNREFLEEKTQLPIFNFSEIPQFLSKNNLQ